MLFCKSKNRSINSYSINCQQHISIRISAIVDTQKTLIVEFTAIIIQSIFFIHFLRHSILWFDIINDNIYYQSDKHDMKSHC